jgi:hypothetical protein
LETLLKLLAICGTNFGKQEDNRMSIRRFSGIVGNQLVRRVCSIAAQTNQHFAPDFSHEGLVTASSSFDVSGTVLSSLSSGQEQQIVIPTRSLTDANGEAHHQVQFPLTQSSCGKKYRKTRPCKLCHEYDVKTLVGFYCFTCGLSAAYCCPSSYQDGRDCFLKHVERIPRRNESRVGV